MHSFDSYNVARDLMEQGQFAEAAAVLDRAPETRPHFKELELLGECFMQLGKLVEAIVPLAAATTLNKGVRAPALLAEVFYELGALHDAADMAELALSRDPRNRQALAVQRKVEDALAR